MRKKFSNDRKDYGKKLIKDYIEYCLHFSKRNVEMARFSLHTLVGQQCRNVYFRLGGKKIDIRTHLLYLQDTGSGKGALYDQVLKFSEDISLNTIDVTRCTAEALIGTSVYDNRTHKYTVKKGILDYAELFCMEEADELFQNMDYEHNKNTFTYIQKSCNSIHGTKTLSGKVKLSSHIHKKLTLGPPIDIDPVASFMLFSYIPDNFIETVATRGLIPRFITVIRHVDLTEREATLDDLLNSLNEGTAKQYDGQYLGIVNRLRMVHNKYGGKAQEFPITEASKEQLRAFGHLMADMIRDASPSAKGTLEGFLVRYLLIAVRLAIHHAMLGLENQVNVEDIAYAKRILLPVWSTLMAYLEMNLIPDELERRIFRNRLHGAVVTYKDLLENGNKIEVKKHNGELWVRRQSIITQVRTRDAWLDSSENASSEYFKVFERAPNEKNPKAWFEQDKPFGRVPYVRLVRDLIT